MAGSQIVEKHQLDPEAYVRFAAHPAARQAMGALLRDHADVLNTLTAAEATSLLAHGSSHATASMKLSVKRCVKHLRILLRECPAFATGVHLSDYRCANPKRKARGSDSRDLKMSVPAYPSVSTFLTNDGFLHGGLQYVRTRLPRVRTELLQRPPTRPTS